jgi:uncharacterized glyoxalase superfamily protein PhnB
VTLRSRSDVALCQSCVDWLVPQLGADSTPIMPVVDMAAAVEFYERAGFGVRVWRGEDDDAGAGYGFVDYDGRSVFDLDAVDIDPARNRAGCYLIVDDADAWHARLTAAELDVTPIDDMPWGMREFTLHDPFGNSIRIGRSVD